MATIDQVADWIDRVVDSFGFETAGVSGQSLADDCVEAVAESISEDCRDGKAPDGSDWDKNRDPYKAWKEKKFGVFDPGYLRGETLSIKALKGEVTVTNDSVVMSHGTGAVDETGASDKQKGEWLTDGCDVDKLGRKQGRPKRPFYSLNKERNTLVVSAMDAGLNKHLGKSGQ